MLELGVGVESCWPHSPQQKGAVENLVGFVKSCFFKGGRFHDQEDLAQQLIEWHGEVNQERACRATGIIPAVRLAEEASRLRSLKVHPKDLIWNDLSTTKYCFLSFSSLFSEKAAQVAVEAAIATVDHSDIRV